DGAIRQVPEPEAEELIDPTGEDQPPVCDPLAGGGEVGVEFHVDPWMPEHALEHGRVALDRHHLEPIGEIAIIAAGARGDARRYRAIEFGGVEAPLLARVASEELLVEF